jgi:hypothetical protein
LGHLFPGYQFGMEKFSVHWYRLKSEKY